MDKFKMKTKYMTVDKDAYVNISASAPDKEMTAFSCYRATGGDKYVNNFEADRIFVADCPSYMGMPARKIIFYSSPDPCPLIRICEGAEPAGDPDMPGSAMFLTATAFDSALNAIVAGGAIDIQDIYEYSGEISVYAVNEDNLSLLPGYSRYQNIRTWYEYNRDVSSIGSLKNFSFVSISFTTENKPGMDI